LVDNELMVETQAIEISYKEDNTRELKALIIGPPDTPYAQGFYQVSLETDKVSLKDHD
jgi:ubiquitin-protein ligase